MTNHDRVTASFCGKARNYAIENGSFARIAELDVDRTSWDPAFSHDSYQLSQCRLRCSLSRVDPLFLLPMQFCVDFFFLFGRVAAPTLQ